MIQADIGATDLGKTDRCPDHIAIHSLPTVSNYHWEITGHELKHTMLLASPSQTR